jgi:putative hemolysin
MEQKDPGLRLLRDFSQSTMWKPVSKPSHTIVHHRMTPMSQKKILYLIVFILLLTVWMVGCAPESDQPEDSPVGLANPASVYCQGLGFEEETREGELGQYGVCIFPDGSDCDTWDFLSGRCGQQYSYCVDQGYELQATKDSSIATCVFDDGSSCNEYLYFEGECKPGEK